MYNEDTFPTKRDYDNAWNQAMKSAFWLAEREDIYSVHGILNMLEDIEKRQPKSMKPLCLTGKEKMVMAELIELKLRAFQKPLRR